jgi:hemolysin D
LEVTVMAPERDRIARDWRQARLDVASLRALSADLSGRFDRTRFVAPDGVPAAEIATALGAAEARENDALVAKAVALLPILQQKRDLYRSLLNVAYTSKVAWLDAEQTYTEQLHQLAIQQAHGGETLAAREALVAQLDQARAGYAHDVLKDLAEAEQKEGGLTQQFAGAAHKAEQTVLTAPIGGTVQGLAVHSLGGVVTPAQALLTVVPDDGPVLVEATVENKDIGFVRAGQDVEVKVRTFEFTRYGLLHGHVVDVSRDRVVDAGQRPAGDPKPGDAANDDGQPKEPGYVAHVALDTARMALDGREETLSPAMSVTAEIKTGRRSVMPYLLSPLQQYVHEGARER